MIGQQNTVPDLKLEQYLLHELSETEMNRISGLIAKDENLQRKVQEMEDFNKDFLEKYPPEEMALSIKHKYSVKQLEEVEESQHSWVSYLKPLAIAAPMMALVIALIIINPFPEWFGSTDSPYTDPMQITRLKGFDPFLRMYKLDAEGEVEIMDEGDWAGENDILQVGYISAGAPYGAIVSVDGRGAVTVHSVSEDGDTELVSDGEQLLPQAYALDDAPEFEAFFFVISLDPVDINQIVSAAEELDTTLLSQGALDAKLDLPSDTYNQTAFIIRKEESK